MLIQADIVVYKANMAKYYLLRTWISSRATGFICYSYNYLNLMPYNNDQRKRQSPPKEVDIIDPPKAISMKTNTPFGLVYE